MAAVGVYVPIDGKRLLTITRAVPKVDLQATHIRALQSGITLRQLEEFALRNDDNRFLPDGKL
ncbi:hypothetical protein RUND412_007851 [Rhizina undulata]